MGGRRLSWACHGLAMGLPWAMMAAKAIIRNAIWRENAIRVNSLKNDLEKSTGAVARSEFCQKLLRRVFLAKA